MREGCVCEGCVREGTRMRGVMSLMTLNIKGEQLSYPAYGYLVPYVVCDSRTHVGFTRGSS